MIKILLFMIVLELILIGITIELNREEKRWQK